MGLATGMPCLLPVLQGMPHPSLVGDIRCNPCTLLQAALAEAEAAEGERASLREQLAAAKAAVAGEEESVVPAVLAIVACFGRRPQQQIKTASSCLS